MPSLFCEGIVIIKCYLKDCDYSTRYFNVVFLVAITRYTRQRMDCKFLPVKQAIRTQVRGVVEDQLYNKHKLLGC